MEYKTPNPPTNPQILPISSLGHQLELMRRRGQLLNPGNVDLENIRTRGVRFVTTKQPKGKD